MKDFLVKNSFKGTIKDNHPLKELTYFKIGGSAKLYLEPASLSDLELISRYYQKNPFTFFILGQGSNILISDHLITEPVISLAQMPRVQEVMDNEFTLSANISIRSLLNIAKDQGFDGFEKLAGIPGSIGASIKMNAGTHLGEISELLNSYQVFNLNSGTTRIIKESDFDFGYRENKNLKKDDIILLAHFKKKVSSPELVRKKIYETLIRRKETQPLESPSCGSVFTNPPGHKAWELIEQAGLKGYKIGAAQISLKHSNWIINLGSAKAQDVYDLIKLIQKNVWEKFNILLQPEVQFIGQFNDSSSR